MIEVTVSPARIPADAAADLEIRLTNSGQDAYLNIIFTIRLPVGIMRLRGPDRITVEQAPPGPVDHLAAPRPGGQRRALPADQPELLLPGPHRPSPPRKRLHRRDHGGPGTHPSAGAEGYSRAEDR